MLDRPTRQVQLGTFMIDSACFDLFAQDLGHPRCEQLLPGVVGNDLLAPRASKHCDRDRLLPSDVHRDRAPCRAATRIMSSSEWVSSFFMMCWRWVSTVLLAMKRRDPISSLL